MKADGLFANGYWHQVYGPKGSNERFEITFVSLRRAYVALPLHFDVQTDVISAALQMSKHNKLVSVFKN